MEPALLAEVIARPHDMAARLICADWLEERGEPRAEFIRLQIALAESGGRLSPEERHRLQQREGALLGRHRRFWNGELHRSLVSAGLRNQVDSRRGLIRSWEYRRGFVESVELHAHALRDFPDAIFRLGPIREFKLYGTPEQIAGVSEWHGEHLQRRGIVILPRDGTPRPRNSRPPDLVAAANPPLEIRADQTTAEPDWWERLRQWIAGS